VPAPVVTPVSPSCNSLPWDMRATLQEVIEPKLMKMLEDVQADKADGGFHDVVGNNESGRRKSSVAVEHCSEGENHPLLVMKHTRLTLNFGGKSVASMDDLVATLASIGRDGGSCKTTSVSGDSDLVDTFVQAKTPPKLIANHENGHEVNAERPSTTITSEDVIFHPQFVPYKRRRDPTWRHAMYISTDVWPADDKENRSPTRRILNLMREHGSVPKARKPSCASPHF